MATEEGLLAFDTTVARGSNVTDSSSSLFRFLPLVRASRSPLPLPHPFKVPFDRPRSIKEGQISFYRLATLPSPFLILESVFNGSDPGRPQSFSFLPIFSRPRNRLLSILWLSVYDYKIRVLWSHVYPDSFFFLLHRTIAIKFAFRARVSSIRRWITAHLEWTDTWETLMDWFLRDSWFRNYRVLLRFFEPLLSELNWNRSDFSVDFVDLVWILFFWGGERDIIVLFELGKLVIVDRIEFYIGTKKKNYFERFCVMKRKFLYSFFFLFSFLIQEQDTWVAIRTEGIRCISCINSSV